MKYDVVRRDNLGELIDSVNSYINQGWLCVGGISVVMDNKRYTVEYFQAVTRED